MTNEQDSLALNYPPQTLEGPGLLHNLINWGEHENDCAIDFWSHGQQHRYSYAQVRSCFNSLALRLEKNLADVSRLDATSKQNVIPLFVPQCAGLYISQLAILNVGAAFCPINLDAPRERIKFVVEDVSASIIITTLELVELVTWEQGPRVIVMEEFPEIPTETLPFHPRTDILPTELAYVMYTSGSSGTPKGVAVSHLAASQSLLAHQKHIPKFKRFLQFAAPSFDVSIFEIFFPLVRGSTLVGCGREQLLNDLPGTINSLNIDAAELTPTVAGSLLQKRENVPSLQLLLTIGEMLTKQIIQEFGGSEGRESMLYGMYGPTEAAIHCNINPSMAATDDPRNIGYPLDTVSNFVAEAATGLDDAQVLKFLPPGEMGELVLGGPQLAQGYLNREEQNKAAFVHFQNQFYYRTGDKAKMLQNGTIEIYGRISAGQVKLRGQRVELGEIERAVCEHPGVQSVVAAILGSVLIVFLLVDDKHIEPRDVLQTCSKWLPKYMVPSEVVISERFPYLPSGKVDKRKLEADYHQQSSLGDKVNADSFSKAEGCLREVLMEILGVSHAHRLAAAGMDSLNAIRVSSKFRALGCSVSTLSILGCETYQSLLKLCEESKFDMSLREEPIISSTNSDKVTLSENVEAVLPCTPLQNSMLAESSMDSRAYWNQIELEVAAIADFQTIREACISLARHNPILRTGFRESEDASGYVQIIWKDLPTMSVEKVDNFNDFAAGDLEHPLHVQVARLGSNWRLLVQIHHALYDAWSLELLLDDFNAILMSHQVQERPSFAKLVTAFEDGSLLVDATASREYWRDHLQGLEVRRIPNFTTSKSPPGLIVARKELAVATSVIEELARRMQASPQSLFQAAYSVIFASYLGSSDICFGTVFSNRTLPVDGIEEMSGPCLATLPIRAEVSSSSMFLELVQDLHARNRKHMAHSVLPLRDIKSVAAVEPRQPLFDTLLIWQQTLHSYDYKRKHVSLVSNIDNLEFNLTLEIIPGSGNIELRANYQQAVLPEAQVQLLLAQIESIILAVVDNHQLSVNELYRSLPAALVSMENPNPTTTLRPGTLSSPVEDIAREDPNRLAISFARSITPGALECEEVTYEELNKRANRFSHHLIEQGLLPDELVCICLEKSIDLYVAILAVAKAGAGYLPVTPDIPSERLNHVLAESKSKLVIVHSASRHHRNSLTGYPVIDLDAIDLSQSSTNNIPSLSRPEDVSYCVFTSGSTGTPKGVTVTQGNLLSNLDVLQDIYPTTKHTRLLQSCSQAFDVSVFEIFFTWRVGGCLCAATKDVLFRDIELAIRALDVTHLSLTPTVAALVDPDKVPNVKFLVTAGEAVTQKVFSAWAGRGLYQGYGPSETTNICTVNPSVSLDDSINNIGRPFSNTSAFVLAPGSDFIPVPRGGEGEFCFGGSQVFRGYLNEEQNIGKIIHHPDHGKLYRSGDFGRLLPDGSLSFTSRKDEQVKIRGQRVELGEINSVMLKSEGVKDCVTMLITSTDKQPAIVCFWSRGRQEDDEFKILNPDNDLLQSLFEKLHLALPAYMIPSTLIPVSHLPSTAQGKIDKRLLVKEFQNLSLEYLTNVSFITDADEVAEWGELESEIADETSLVTGVSRSQILPNTSFFALGIDSISAIALARKISNMTSRQVEISQILKHSTPRRLAQELNKVTLARIAKVTSQATFVEKPGSFFDEELLQNITKRFEEAGLKVENILPCTPLQIAMLSAAEASGQTLYSNEVKFHVTGDPRRLEYCWSEMVKRHQILRTFFVETEHPSSPYMQVVLASDHASTREGSAFPDGLKKPYSTRFESLNERNTFYLTMHHAMYDGVALEVLYSEVEKVYRNEELPNSVSFYPFLQHTLSLDLQNAENYWSKILDNFTPSLLSETAGTAFSPTGQKNSQIRKSFFDTPLSEIESNIKQHTTTLLSACHAAWARVLSQYLQETDICFGNIVSGRTVPIEGVDRLVAPCFNTIPVRLKDIHNTSFLEALRSIHNTNIDSLSFQFTPLRHLQSKFSPYGSRLFDTLFILQQPAQDLDESIWSFEGDSGIMDFPLVCEVVPRKTTNQLEVILHSYTSVLSEDRASELLQSFQSIFISILENPRRQMLTSFIKQEILAKQEDKAYSANTTAVIEPSSDTVWSSLENTVRDIITSFTDVPREQIGKTTSIFRLGLDSISTVQVATALRKQGHRVYGSDVMVYSTIARLAVYLSSHAEVTPRIRSFDFSSFDQEHRLSIIDRFGLSDAQIETILPCTPVQSGMLARSLHSDGEEYVNSISFELEPSISIHAFRQAWRIVRSKHEMLRTGFFATEKPVYPFGMVVFNDDAFGLPWIEDGENNRNKTKPVEELLLHPWALVVVNKIGRPQIKLQAHHALYDAQSMQLILSDVVNILAGVEVQTSPPITPLLAALLDSTADNQEEKLAFWQREETKIIVNRFPELTPLRVSKVQNEVRQFLSRSTLSTLESTCRELGVTMQAACQATWARILAAYTSEPSTTFGITLSGRSAHEMADEIAFPTIVTLPVRCDVSGTNAELLQKTMSGNAELHKYQFTPMTSIQKWSGYPEGKMFDTLFAYQKLGNDKSVKTPWVITDEEAFVDYAISMEVLPESTGELVFRLTYKTNIIPQDHAKLLLRQYDSLLHDILENQGASCDLALDFDYNLLSITPADQPELRGPASLLHDFVTLGAQTWPGKTAFEFATCLEPGKFKSETWTYDQLDKESNKIANLLITRNVLPGQLVGICFDKCPEASFAIVGIMKAGCAYVALDPTAPLERLSYISRDAQAEIILTAGAPASKITSIDGVEMLRLDEPGVLSDQSDQKPILTRNIVPEDVSYCLYTSGTTGTPKGCLITHENAVQAMYAFQILFAGHWTEDSKWLQFASFHFDVSVLEQFWSWSVGICVASAPRDLIFEDIPGAIQQLGITHIDLTPSLARLLDPNDVPSLTKGVFITGGESLKQEILDTWGEHACIYNGYGPTEATIGVTMYPRVPSNGSLANIGPAFENVGSFVLKPGTDLPVLRGAVGELCVSGKLVGKGYLNRPELTEERFPTLRAYDERVYRTGDLVRILHDGSFIFLGRADDQVKLRGQRLELTEINSVIKNSTSQVDEVVTFVLKHSLQRKEQLVSFFVVKPTAQKDPGAEIGFMRDACKLRLPGYMVPTHFIPIPKIPLNANNKADSKQLATLYDSMTLDTLQKLSHINSESKGWTQQEQAVIDDIAKIISMDASDITRGSNIFELGVDSISIIGFARGLQKLGHKGAKLSVVKKNTSIENIVSVLLSGNGSDRAIDNAYILAKQSILAFSQKHMASICEELGISSHEIEAVAPCTPVQEGLIYRFLQSDSYLYFNEFNFKVQVNVEDLLLAWDRVIEKVQVLRTKFVETDDGFAQVVLRSKEFLDFGNRLRSQNNNKIADLLEPFKLDLQMKPGGGSMKIRIFHALYDGNSLTKLLQCVVNELRLKKDIDYGPAFHESLPYGPLVQTSKEAQNFWSALLEDWTPAALSLKAKAIEKAIVTNNTIKMAGFDALRKSLGVSHQAIIQAAWIAVLQNLNSRISTIGIVNSGRTIDFADAENVIGPLFNTLPFHFHVSSGGKWKDLILQCHELNMKIQEFHHTPLKDIQKWSPAKHGETLFDVLFVFQRPDIEDKGFADDIWTIIGDAQVADYPLALEATLDQGDVNLSLAIVAQGSFFDEKETIVLLRNVVCALEEIMRHQGESVLQVKGRSEDGFEHDSTPLEEEEEDAQLRSTNHSFNWTDKAQSIRAELSGLSKIPQTSITEHSSVFEIGLDSIDIIKLSSRLKRKGIFIPVSKILKAQSISAMMNKDLTTQEPSRFKAHHGIFTKICQDLDIYFKDKRSLVDLEEIIPATPLQQGMVNEMITSEYERYFNIDAFKLDAGIDAQRLQRAFETVLKASPILRTRFIEVEDPDIPVSFAQLIYKANSEFALPIFNTQSPSGEQTVEKFLGQFRQVAIRRIRDNGSTFQVSFVEIQGLNYMLIAIAHALYDGTSLRMLHDDLSKAYDGFNVGRPKSKPFISEIFSSTTPDAKTFWRATLSSLPSSVFPARDIEPSIVTTRLERISRLPLKTLERVCKTCKVTMQTLGQACWALVLSHILKKLDVTFGSVLSCRDDEEASEVMFPLMNTLIVRAILHGTLGEFLNHIQTLGNKIRQYQHFPLATARTYARVSTNHNTESRQAALFDSLFIYQGKRIVSQRKPLYETVFATSDVEYPVCVELELVDENHLLWTTACKNTVDVKAERILDLLDLVLEQITSHLQSQTIDTTSDGISIAGLPRFNLIKDTPEEKAGPKIEPVKNIRKFTPTEIKVSKALEELSGVPMDEMEKDTTIFQLGLDSILILKLPALLRTYGIAMRVSDILKAQSIMVMACLIDNSEASPEVVIDSDAVLKDATSNIDVESHRLDLERDAGLIQEVLPVTAGQLYMIRHWQNSRGVLFYPTFTFKINGQINKARLDRAWRILTSRHEILRTGFLEIKGRIFQIVYAGPHNDIIYQKKASPPLRRHNLAYPPINLILEEGEGDTELNITMHHALYDGISLPLMLQELEALYEDKPLLSSSLRFRDFVAQSHAAASAEDVRKQWTEYLQTDTEFETSKKRRSSQNNIRTGLYHPLNEISDLTRKARSLDVSTDAVILASITRVRAQHLSSKLSVVDVPYIIVGAYLANRGPFSEDLSMLVAPTLNLLPLIIRKPLTSTVDELAKAIQKDLHMLGDGRMTSIRLEDIFTWTGKTVDFWVNIVKDPKKTGHKDTKVQALLVPKNEIETKKAEVIEEVPNLRITSSGGIAKGTYIPSIDVEIRYHPTSRESMEAMVDVGIFGPSELVNLDEADAMIEEFVEILNFK